MQSFNSDARSAILRCFVIQPQKFRLFTISYVKNQRFSSNLSLFAQVSNSISILEKVKTQTEGYVNNTGKNLGQMEGTVEGLSERMVDVDSNLNYMLGQLSLVVQEFNQVKTGLNEAMSGLEGELDDIKEYKPSEGEDNAGE